MKAPVPLQGYGGGSVFLPRIDIVSGGSLFSSQVHRGGEIAMFCVQSQVPWKAKLLFRSK